MLDIIFALLIAIVAHYAGSATGMGSYEAIATGIITGGIAGALSRLRLHRNFVPF